MALVYPPTGFHFTVVFEPSILGAYPGIPDIGFQEVTGLTSEITVEEYREGGENRFAHKFPNPANYTNIVLKRGVLIGSSLTKWFKDCVENFNVVPFNLVITLQNELHLPLMAWNVTNAFPIKWEVSGMNAMESQVMVETVEMSYQYFRVIDPTSALNLF